MPRKPKDTTTKPADQAASKSPANNADPGALTAAEAIAAVVERGRGSGDGPEVGIVTDEQLNDIARPRQETPADDDGSKAGAAESDSYSNRWIDESIGEFVAASDADRLNAAAGTKANPFEVLYADQDPDDAPAAVITFSGYLNSGKLPAIPPPGDRMDPNRLGAIADVFHASGYFGDLTPAQIATHILIGQSIGLDASQSVVDLEVGPGPTVRYKLARQVEAAADVVQAEKARPLDLVTPEPASIEATGCRTCGSPKPKLHPAVQFEGEVSPCSDPFHGSNVSPLFPNAKVVDGDAGRKIAELPGGQRFDVTDIVDKINADAANAGPVLDPDPERLLPGPDSEPDQARPDSASAPGDSSNISVRDPADLHSGPDAGAFGTTGPIGNDAAELAASWRAQIVEITTQIAGDAIEKGKTFDALSRPKQKEMFEKATIYFRSKIDELRTFVINALIADGKPSIDSQRGFFLYVDVPADPAAWNYTEARRSADAIAEFTSPNRAA